MIARVVTEFGTGRASTIAVMVAFWSWFCLMCFTMIGVTTDFSADVPTDFGTGGILIGQIGGLVLFVTTVILTHPSQAISSLGRLGLAQAGIVIIMYLSLALQLHGDEVTILIGIFYTLVLLVTALMISVLWTLAPADVELCMSVAAIVFCTFGIAALAILGLPEGRNVGGIQPNIFAAPLLAGFILSQFRPGLIGIAVRILCFVMIALVSSRFALISCAMAFILFQLTFHPPSPGRIAAMVTALLPVIFLWPLIAHLFALDDPLRDASSGISGRDEFWSTSLAAITDHPFGLGFKRASIFESGHNGYLKTLVEFGVVGGGLIIFLFGCIIAAAGVEAARSTGQDRRQRRFACARFGGLVALAFGAFFQPQLLSLGDAPGILLLVLLFRPGMTSVSDRAAAVRAA